MKTLIDTADLLSFIADGVTSDRVRTLRDVAGTLADIAFLHKVSEHIDQELILFSCRRCWPRLATCLEFFSNAVPADDCLIDEVKRHVRMHELQAECLRLSRVFSDWSIRAERIAERVS